MIRCKITKNHKTRDSFHTLKFLFNTIYFNLLNNRSEKCNLVVLSLHSCAYLSFKDHPAGLILMDFCFCLLYPLHSQNFTVKRLKYSIALFLADEHENIFSHLTHTHTQRERADIWYTTVTSSVGVMEGCRRSRGRRRGGREGTIEKRLKAARCVCRCRRRW